MPKADLISIVISTYNRSDALLAVLAGLTRQSDRNFEVIVADDGSRNEHCLALRNSTLARELKVIHVWQPDVGFTLNRNRNLGANACSGDYLVFLDGDCVPETDFVAQHRRLAQVGYFVNGSRVLLSEKLSNRVIQGQVSVVDRSWWFWLVQRMTRHANKLMGLLRLPDGPYRVKPDFVWKGIRGANLAVWKVDLERVDGFDESFLGWGHDDADFVLRLHNAGLKRKNGFCATEVYHLWHCEAARDAESVNAQKVRERAQSRQYLPTLGYRESRGGQEVTIRTLG